MPDSQPKRRLLLRTVLSLLALIGIGVGAYELAHWYTHVYEPNGTVHSDFTVLSSSVNGNIETIHVREGVLVEAGARLASMDADIAALDVRSLEAEIEKEKATRRRVEAELEFFLVELEDKIATARESVKLLEREYTTLAERRRIARTNVERNAELLTRSVVSKQRIDDANDKLLEITSKLRDLETDLRVNEKKLQEMEGQRKQENVYRSRIGVIDRDIDKIAIRLEQSREVLEDMHIDSPIRGIINEVFVNPGAYVEDGDKVFLLHDPDNVWVEANVDESDIRHVEVGQAVDIEFDAYPFEHFTGKVRAIGRVTVSMINGDDRTKNGVGTEQQIPVIIDLPTMEKPVWPGMRAAVNISVR